MPFMKDSKCKHTCNHSCYSPDLGWICEVHGDCDMCSCCSSFEPRDEKLSFPDEPVVINERKVKRLLKSRLKKQKQILVVRTRMTEPELRFFINIGFVNIDNKQTGLEYFNSTILPRLRRTDWDMIDVKQAIGRIIVELTEFQKYDEIQKKLKAFDLIKENLVVSCDESVNDKPCLMIAVKIDKDKLVVIYETFDKEKIALLKEVLINEQN